jgi:iron complex outermembrane recepter protein
MCKSLLSLISRYLLNRCGCLHIYTIAIMLFPTMVFAQPLISFDIQQQRADLALTQFAQQAKTTLLFPYDLAQQETANALHGDYPVELAIVKLLEGTGLFAFVNEAGQLSVKAVHVESAQPKLSIDDSQGKAADQVSVKEQKVKSANQDIFEKIAVVGSRASPRSVGNSPLPVDVISQQELKSQGSTDMLVMLRSVVPSFNFNDQPINDASTLVRPANLRGLASDHTLVLVNGKRRHRSAVITFLGGGLSDGAQGPDISTIPVSALKQIEVLRDGAAAQYGSDAIAGVINFVLKDDPDGGLVDLHYGSYFAGDGENIKLATNLGLPLSEDGFANFSLELQQTKPTSRSVQRDDAASLINGGNLAVANPAQIWGSPELNNDLKFFANFALDLSQSKRLYWFGNFAQRQVEGGFYFRSPHSREGVYKGSGIYDGPLDSNGNPGDLDIDGNPILSPTLLVGDLDGIGFGVECPVVRISDNNVLDDEDYQLIADNSSAVGKNCFAFNEILPGGFTPRFGGTIRDTSAVVGTDGSFANNWSYDVSANFGRNSVDFVIHDTVNPSLGPLSPTHFTPGKYIQSEESLDIDLSKPFHIGLSEPFNLAAGMQYRHESYQSIAGDPASFAIGPLADQGFGIGSNGFPGLSINSQRKNSRHNLAFYLDTEVFPSEDILLTAAFRYEDYSDFGNTLKGKLATRWQLNHDFALRGAISSGFKAPTIGQTSVRNVTTAFGSDGKLIDRATLPPGDPISIQKGASELRPEQSVSLSAGLVAEFDNGFFATMDYYHIKVSDRISTTSGIKLSAQDIATLLAQGVDDASSFTEISYFTNDFDTTTEGVDIVANYEMSWWAGHTAYSLAYNWTSTEVKKASANISPFRVRMLENNLPPIRYSFTVRHDFTDISLLSRLNYAGSIFEDHLDSGLPIDKIGSEYTLDLELSYQLNPELSLVLGAKNALNERPDKNQLYDTEYAGAKYPATSAIGINGGYYYTSVLYRF